MARIREEAKEKGKRALSTAHQAHIVVVYSPQGGAGTTTIATNLAASWMHEGTKVLLIDADLQFGDVGVFLKLKAADTIIDLIHSGVDLDREEGDNLPDNPQTGQYVLLDT